MTHVSFMAPLMVGAITVPAFLAFCGPAMADSCKEEFIELMTNRTTTEPTRIHVVQDIRGAAKTVNLNYQDGKGNWRTEMLEPENAPWSMGIGNVLYTSSDKGKSWQKVREMDDANAAHDATMADRVSTVSNVQCGEEELDGVIHRTVEADYKMAGSFEADIHDKFWMNPETGYVPRLETTMKSASFESFLIQNLEPAPDLTFPQID